MGVDLVPHLVRHAVNRPLETLVAEGLDPAAIVTDQVVVMILRRDPLEASARPSDEHALHEIELAQELERPVDARQADAATVGAEAVEDLLGGQTAVLAGEQVDDGTLRRSTAVAGGANAFECRFRPALHVSDRMRGCGSGPQRLPSARMITRIVLICALALGLVACGGGDASSGSERDVVAAFYPLAYAAERVGGDSVEVENLTPPGAEPHDVELSPRDVETVRAADVVLYLGSDFQPAVEDAVDGADGEAVDVLSGLELIAGEGHEEEDEAAFGHAGEEEGGEIDPHVWLDPLRFAQVVERVGTVLDRPRAARELGDELRQLDAEYQRGLRDCERRELVTSHAAFGYLAGRYRLEQIPVTGLSPEAEPSARELEEVVHEVEETGATTVFFETLVSPRLARTVARETGARTAELNPLEGLTEDELESGANYFSVMRANLDALRQALGCR
jgi:zinc transport system substrate-binding protein